MSGSLRDYQKFSTTEISYVLFLRNSKERRGWGNEDLFEALLLRNGQK
jgi:hypothetical protein